MLYFNRKRRPRVSNQLAVLSAVLLLITAVAGSSTESTGPDHTQAAISVSQNEAKNPGQTTAASQQAISKPKFRISSLIFRHH